jgi:hypothetical protein
MNLNTILGATADRTNGPSPPASENSSRSPTSIIHLQVDRNPQDIDSTKKSSVGSSDSSLESMDLHNNKRGRSVSFKDLGKDDGKADEDSYFGEMEMELEMEEGRALADHPEGKEEAKPSKVAIAFWLIFWLVNNVVLTLLNKATFSKFDFKYPFFLSFFHMMCNWAGGAIYFRCLEWYTSRSPSVRDEAYHRRHGYQRSKSVLMDNAKVSTLDNAGTIKTWAFSVIFSLNIAIGNVSLRYVSVNFNQVMRSLVPAVAIIFGYCLGKATSRKRKIAVIPVVAGVAMACFGEMSITMIGFVFTSLCVVLAALKVSVIAVDSFLI